MGKRKVKKSVFLVIISFILGGIACYFGYNYILNKGIIKIDNKKITTTTIEEVSDLKKAINEVYDAVVYVEVHDDGEKISSGSGFIYKKDNSNAYILTNYHVIQNGNSFSVTLSNGKEIKAKYINGDQYYDMAILKIESKEVTKVVKLGDSSKVELGDTVFTVGSPLGKDYMGTITKGIISGINRMLSVKLASGSYLMEVIQVDASINSGNSGGPLCNINGEVIGITSSKATGNYVEGMGFAIPINSIQAILDGIEKGEVIERPYLGVQLADMVAKQLLEYNYKVKVSDKAKYGAILSYIEEGKTADKAGLKAGDVIIEVNGKKVEDVSHFKYELYKYKKGDKVTIKYYSEDELKETTLTLSETIRSN